MFYGQRILQPIYEYDTIKIEFLDPVHIESFSGNSNSLKGRIRNSLVFLHDSSGLKFEKEKINTR